MPWMWSLRTDDSAELLHVDVEENTHFSPIAKRAPCMSSAKGQWGILLAFFFSPWFMPVWYSLLSDAVKLGNGGNPRAGHQVPQVKT